MKTLSKINRPLMILLHFALGIVAVNSVLLTTIWVVGFLLFSTIWLVRYQNKDGYAHLAAAYIVNLEFISRNVEAPLPWEIGKYGVAYLLMLGLLVERLKKPFPNFALLYFIALLPSIVVINYPSIEEAREQVAFNLMGPFVIALSIIYFYKRNVAKEELENIFYFLALPIVSLMAIIVIKLPDLGTYAFIGYKSNTDTSGGMGANQVSVIMSFAALLLPISWLLKLSITGNRLLDIGFGMAGLLFAFFTFSRGGLASGVAAMLAMFFVAYTGGFQIKQIKNILSALVIVGVIGVGAWLYVNNLTRGALEARYMGTIQEEALTATSHQVTPVDLTGRDLIFFADIHTFMSHPFLGVGPGMGMYYRSQEGFFAAAHIEQTRLLAEHGMYGLIAMYLIFIYPIGIFKKMTLSGRILALGLVVFSGVTMLHNATRLVLIAFIFGLAFISYSDSLNKTANPLIRK